MKLQKARTDPLTAVATPGAQDIIGAALVTNSVTVNGGTADRHGEYFHRQISVANTNQAVWQMVTNNSGTVADTGGLAFPASNQTLVYDADGNLTFDGIWNYQWDGENRLISMNMTNLAGLNPNAQGLVTNRLRLDFTYDYMGRRIQKTVSVWNSVASGFQTSANENFAFDGWNLLATLNSQLSVIQSFAWGFDLSGTITKAGGVGGLLMADISGTNCFACYDGNGNVTAYVNAANNSITARYEYNPYGQLIRKTGVLASIIPFRYSTKIWDEECGLIFYNFRFYSSSIGKWINRDRMAEKAGLNIMQFVENNPINNFDGAGNFTIRTPSIYSPGLFNAKDGFSTYSATETGCVLGEIRGGIDLFNGYGLANAALGLDAEVYAFILCNFAPGGNLDYGKTHQNNGSFDFFGQKESGYGFANSLFGYSTGFATFECEEEGFAAAAAVATISDGIRDIIKHGGAAGYLDVFNGYLYGVMDSLFGSDDD